MLKLLARVFLAVGLVGCGVSCSRGRSVADVTAELRARGVGRELGATRRATRRWR